jgi:hypothetical protein
MRRKKLKAEVTLEWTLDVCWFDAAERPGTSSDPFVMLDWTLPSGRHGISHGPTKDLLELVGESIEHLFEQIDDLAPPGRVRVNHPDVAAVMRMAWPMVEVILEDGDAPEPATPGWTVSLH